MLSLRMILEMLHAVQSRSRIFTFRMWTWYSTRDPECPDVIVNVSSETVLLAEDPRPLF